MIIHVPRLTRRNFLRTLGQGALALAAVPEALFADEANAVTISLLHTTDLHGHILPTSDYQGHADLGGLARCATQLRRWRAANPQSLLLDIGDVYQGTAVSLATRGAVMFRCLNALGYDAWVIGNHEFDWGLEVLAAGIAASRMPVLSGNVMIDGRRPASIQDVAHPLASIRPFIVREVAGFRLAIVGLTTPALTTWLPPEKLAGFEPLDPVEALRGLLREVSAQRPDAIILAGHMGLTRRDDFANQIGRLTREFPQLAVCLGGHTHQDHPGEWVNGVLYTQADHFGIHAGKVDLTFDRRTRQLLRRDSTTVRMDASVPLDPLVLSLSQRDLAAADQVLRHPIGVLTESFGTSSIFGQPGEQERLIGSAILDGLRKRGVGPDAVLHGLFDGPPELAPGVKTVADAWTLLPYENEIVTVELAYDDLLAVAQEVSQARELRQFMGMQLVGAREGGRLHVAALRAGDGSPLGNKATFRLAMNSYDSQSGGGRFPLLAQRVAQPAHRRVLHPIQVRDAVIDFFASRGSVGQASLLV